MKKSFTFSLTILLLSSTLSFGQAPPWAWVSCPSGKGSATALATDAAGNSYISGGYIDTLYFASDTLFAPPSIYNPVFLAKYDPSGNLLSAKNIAYSPGSVGFANISLA